MSTSLLIQFVAPVVAAFVGGAIGWCLRGRPQSKPAKQREQPRKQAAAQILQSLQAAAETVRSCVEQHTDCIRTIQSELNRSTSTEPAIITKMAEIDHRVEWPRPAPMQRHPQFAQQSAARRSAIGWPIRTACCSRSPRSIDNNKRTTRFWLRWKSLAAELAGEIKGHGQRLQKISGDLENCADQTAAASGKRRDADSRRHRRRSKANRRSRAADCRPRPKACRCRRF